MSGPNGRLRVRRFDEVKREQGTIHDELGSDRRYSSDAQ